MGKCRNAEVTQKKYGYKCKHRCKYRNIFFLKNNLNTDTRKAGDPKNIDKNTNTGAGGNA